MFRQFNQNFVIEWHVRTILHSAACRHRRSRLREVGKSDKHIDELAYEFEETMDTGAFLLEHFS